MQHLLKGDKDEGVGGEKEEEEEEEEGEEASLHPHDFNEL